jgi:hypothetical protein
MCCAELEQARVPEIVSRPLAAAANQQLVLVITITVMAVLDAPTARGGPSAGLLDPVYPKI